MINWFMYVQFSNCLTVCCWRPVTVTLHRVPHTTSPLAMIFTWQTFGYVKTALFNSLLHLFHSLFSLSLSLSLSLPLILPHSLSPSLSSPLSPSLPPSLPISPPLSQYQKFILIWLYTAFAAELNVLLICCKAVERFVLFCSACAWCLLWSVRGRGMWTLDATWEHDGFQSVHLGEYTAAASCDWRLSCPVLFTLALPAYTGTTHRPVETAFLSIPVTCQNIICCLKNVILKDHCHLTNIHCYVLFQASLMIGPVHS